MNTQAQLRKQAITAAKNQEWSEAVRINTQLLELNSQDVQALNRLGVAYIQLSDKKQAVSTFEKSLEIDKTNIIAKKNLDKLKSNQITTPSFTAQQFIEEPGRTKTVELCRLANKTTLKKLSTGIECQLKAKKRCVSVEVDGVYVGVLPDDISFRLTKLIQTGNTYSCYIYSTSDTKCSVYIKEETRSPQNEDYLSFPSNKNSSQVDIMTDTAMLDEYIPVEVTDHDSDVEKTIDDLDDEYDEDSTEDSSDDSDDDSDD